MASRRSCLHYSSCQNLFLDSISLFLGPALSCNPILGPAAVLALAPTPIPTSALALVPAPAFTLAATNDLFKQFIKAYLETNQGPRQSPVERKGLFKAKVPEVYYTKLYMDCYHFSQQCKDHFEIARTIVAN